MGDEVRCSRCDRTSQDFQEGSPGVRIATWEVISVTPDLWSCPDCLTPEEEQAIDADMMELASCMAYCVRCHRLYDDLIDQYSDSWLFPYADDDGWLICPGCLHPSGSDSRLALISGRSPAVSDQ